MAVDVQIDAPQQQKPRGAPRRGTVDFVSADIDPDTDTLLVRARLPNPDVELVPGQYTRVRMLMGQDPDQLLIPPQALGQDQDGYYVYVVGDDRRAALGKVTLGTTYQGKRVVRKGLGAGEQVLVEGIQQVRPGDLIEPREGAPGES